MANPIFDDEKLTVNCPNCSHEITETIGFFRSSPEVACPGCDASVKFDASGLDEGLKGTEQALDEFLRSPLLK